MRCAFTFVVAALSAGSLLVSLAGCKDRHAETKVIQETRTAGTAPSVPTNLSATDRLLPRRAMTMPDDHPPVDGMGAMPAATSAAGGSLAWDQPEGWTVGPARAMRLVTFFAGADQKTECYIAELGGQGGGAEANFNRWRGQLGQGPFAAGEFDALPKIAMLGQQASMMDVSGTYRGMGDTLQENSKLLGSLASADDRTFFVKLVGPAAEVDAARDAFVALCGSLRLQPE